MQSLLGFSLDLDAPGPYAWCCLSEFLGSRPQPGDTFPPPHKTTHTTPHLRTEQGGPAPTGAGRATGQATFSCPQALSMLLSLGEGPAGPQEGSSGESPAPL